MPLSIGPMEIAFLLLVALAVAAAIVVSFGRLAWTAGLAVCVAIAAAVTPADLVSTLVVAAPYALGYTYVVLRRGPRHALK